MSKLIVETSKAKPKKSATNAKKKGKTISKPKESEMNKKSRGWSFTLNNYTTEELDNLENLDCGKTNRIRGIQYVGQKCPTTGTPHLQGYIIFNDRPRGSMVKKELKTKRVNVEAIYADSESNDIYTSRSDTFDKEANIFVRKGDPTLHQGKRNDINKIIDNLKGGMEIKEAIDGNEKAFIKYHTGITKYSSMVQKIDPEVLEEAQNITYSEWHKELLIKLSEKANGEDIIWIYGKEEAKSKRKFYEKYSTENNETCYAINNIGKLSDCCDGLRNWMLGGKKPKVILINIPSAAEITQDLYIFIENIKDGEVTCGKYSVCKLRFAKPHVVIFANRPPKIKMEINGELEDMISIDRYIIYTVEDDKLEFVRIRKDEMEELDDGEYAII